MENANNKSAIYKIVKTNESINGKSVEMYGVEGVSEDDVVTLKALSVDKARMSRLVTAMNDCGLEICQLRDVVDDFLYYQNKEKENKE
jgi:hypothetical protein